MIISNQESGFSLFEVTIAWSICMVILVGILVQGNESLISVHHRYLQTIAVNRLQEMLERLRANDNSDKQEQEFNIWNQQNMVLPKGNGEYYCDEITKICTINIYWHEHEEQNLKIQALVKTNNF